MEIVRRQEALAAMCYAMFAGLVVAPIALLLIQFAFGNVYFAETAGGAAFAVGFFAVTSFAVAMQRAVMLSYIVKSLLVVGVVSVASFDGVNNDAAAISIAVSALTYLMVQTTYVVRRKGRVQRAVSRSS